jgi:hypothetical protein
LCFLLFSFDPPAYIQPFEFLKNESTNQYLVIKWRPTIEGKFPNGVLMNMTQMLPHFDVSSYIFDMTPGETYKEREFRSSVK